MARFDKSSTKSSKSDAAVAAARAPKRSSSSSSYEDTMFFPRLRRHAKWMFVFLAVALGGGFVLFGVGAGGTGVGDILRGGGQTSGLPSISSSQKRTQENPKDVQAWRDLSTALQTDGQTERAIAAQEKVVALEPKNADALRELAGLYLAQATAKQQAAQIIQIQAAYNTSAGEGLPGLLTGPNGQSLLSNKIAALIGTQANAKVQELAIASQEASAQAVAAYKKIAALSPNDPNVQLELAQAAQSAGDTATAIAAYAKFLELAPDDPSASIVKSQLEQLKQSQSSSG